MSHLVKIGAFCETNSGGTPSREKLEQYYGGSIPWVKSGELRENYITDTEEKITELALKESSAKLNKANSILLAMYGATVGRMAILGVDAATNQAVCAIKPDPEKADLRYVFHALQRKIPEFLLRAKGGAQPNISQGMIRETEISLPSLDEQKRIAAILDKADSLRRKRQQALQLADDFLRATFLDLFGDPVTNPKGLNVVPLISLCKKITDGTHQSPKWEDSGIPFLFISNIVDGEIVFETNKFIGEDTYSELTKSTPIEVNDILYTTVGSYGNVALVESDRRFCFQRHIAHIKPDEKVVLPLFLSQMLASGVIRKQADSLVRGVAQKTLNLKDLKNILVFDLPFERQMQYLRMVRKVLFARKSNMLSAKVIDELACSLNAKLI